MSNQNEIEVRISATTEDLKQGMDRAERVVEDGVRNIKADTQNIAINIDMTGLKAQMKAATDAIKKIKVDPVVKLDTQPIQNELRGIGAVNAKVMRQIRDEAAATRQAMSDLANSIKHAGNDAGHTSYFMANLKAELASMAFYALIGFFHQLSVALIETSDSAALLNARFKDQLGSLAEVADMKERLYAAAQRLQASYQDMATAAARMVPSLQDMGKGADDAVRLSEVLMTTAKLSGASTQEAASAAQQFSQALGSSVLQGDELKSILENNQSLARTLAAALKLPDKDIKVTIGMLRGLGEEGKITSEVMANALLNSYDTVMAKADDLPKTFSGTWTTVKNVMFKAVDEMNEKQVFAGMLDGLADLGKQIEKLQKDGTLAEWGKGIADVLVAVGGAFKELLSIVGQNLSEIGSLWSDLTGSIQSGTGVQISAWNMLTGAIKGFHAFFIGLRVGIKIIMEAIKWAIKDGVAVMIAAWLSLKTAVITIVLSIRTFIEVLIQLLKTMANVALHAFSLDFSGAKQAWSDGVSELEQISKKGNQRIVDNAKVAAGDFAAAWQTSGTGSGENARRIADVAQASNDKLKGLFTDSPSVSAKVKTDAPLAEIEKVTVGSGKAKKSKTPKSQMRDFESGLNAEKNAWEQNNATNGTLQEFPIEKVVEYWANVLSTEKMTAQDRINVEKKLLDAKRDIRQRDHDETQRGLEAQLSAYSNNYAQRLKIQNDLLLHAEFAYGKESKQAVQAQAELEKIKRAASLSDIDLMEDAVDAREKFALDDLENQKTIKQREYEYGLITYKALLTAEAAYEDQRYAIKEQALKDRLALWERENNLTGDADPQKRQTIVDEQTTLGKSRDSSKQANTQAMAAAEMGQYFGGLSDQMTSLWDRGLQSMLDGTLTWKGAMQAIWSDLSMFFLKKLVTDPMRDWLLMQGKKLAMQFFYKKAEVATETAGEAAKTGAVAAGEAARTGFTFMGFMARIGIAVMEAIKTIAIYAWQAMAGAYAALVAIPFVGPVIAPIAAAVSFAGVMALAGKVKSASGGYDIPAGVNPMTQLHAEEMVLPAKYANVIRGMASGDQPAVGAQGGGDTINVNIHALDARSMVRLMKDNRNGLAAAVSAGIREFKGAKP